MNIRRFGQLQNGEEVKEVTLHQGYLSMRILTLGAIIRDLTFAGRPLVLGFDSLDAYLSYESCYGLVGGRNSGRLGGDRVWSIESVSANSMSLSIDIALHNGPEVNYVEATCNISLSPNNSVKLEIVGRSTGSRCFHPYQHVYFNLSDKADIGSHQIMIPASSYFPVGEDNLPTGEIRDVNETPYSFQEMREMDVDNGKAVDFSYCLRMFPLRRPHLCAVVEEPSSMTKMEVWSTEPSLHFYDGAKLNIPIEGHNGRTYGAKAGFCLEPQSWPDISTGAETLFNAGHYRHITEYRFS
ncbi:aldose epimerase family protein [Flexibacterium corallicola]|uniref:aldose epimerase family protein n=1 Tax=Flexibacterium corallicola TaxID=3037259 RepID=UPI00286F265D|nr:galactose mutarotase [Pseudovibrio sp. M1P-2-3]